MKYFLYEFKTYLNLNKTFEINKYKIFKTLTI